ncbi:guanylate kinase [compost metagenome]
MNLLRHYDYAVLNDEIDAACDRIRSIIIAEHCRRERYVPYVSGMVAAIEKA